MAQGDAASLERAAHLLKGSIGCFAAPGPFHAAQKLENIARGRDLSGAPEALAQLEAKVRSLEEILAEYTIPPRKEYVS